MPMNSKKGLAAFFAGALQSVGQMQLRKFLEQQKESAGKRQATFETETQMAVDKINDPNTPYFEKIQWNEQYKQHTGHYLPMNQEGLVNPPLISPETVHKRKAEIEKTGLEREKLTWQARAAQALANERNARAGKIKSDLSKIPGTAKNEDIKYQIQLLNNEADNLMARQKNLMDSFGTVRDQTAFDKIDDELNEIERRSKDLQNQLFKSVPTDTTKRTIPGF